LGGSESTDQDCLWGPGGFKEQAWGFDAQETTKVVESEGSKKETPNRTPFGNPVV